jgi:hypothetical protein
MVLFNVQGPLAQRVTGAISNEDNANNASHFTSRSAPKVKADVEAEPLRGVRASDGAVFFVGQGAY